MVVGVRRSTDNNTKKKCGSIIAQPLADIINTIFTTSSYPDSLKIAKAIPIFKNGDKLKPENYRPTALLPVITKVIEKLLLKRLSLFFSENNLITPSQYGFIKRKSTDLALLNMAEKTKQNIELKLLTMGIFVDLTKAFDLINHELLLQKLSAYGVRGVALNLIESYLSNRCQFVTLADTISTTKPIAIGVPQGSILGPFLFLMYINDLAAYLQKDCVLYADDRNIFISNASMKELYM